MSFEHVPSCDLTEPKYLNSLTFFRGTSPVLLLNYSSISAILSSDVHINCIILNKSAYLKYRATTTIVGSLS